jgi:hypothetical protein
VADHVFGGLHCSEVAEQASAFVLGALEPAEMDAVRGHIASCPEAHAEIAELGGVGPALFETVDLVDPPASLRERILAAAAAETQRGAGPGAAVPAARRAAPPATVTPIPPRGTGSAWDIGTFLRRPIWAGVAIAAVVAVIALGAWNVQLRNDIDGLTAYRNGVVAVLDQAAQPGAQLAVLTPPGGSGGPSGLAAVTGGGANVSLVMRDLRATAGPEVYEAWLIAGDNAPVPIGSFTVDPSGAATFATSAVPLGDLPSVTVAVTREPRAGATTPTLPVVVLGTAQPQDS